MVGFFFDFGIEILQMAKNLVLKAKMLKNGKVRISLGWKNFLSQNRLRTSQKVYQNEYLKI